jgi:hypothetical protein
MQIKNRQQLFIIVAGVVFGLLIGDALVFRRLRNSWKARATKIADLRKQVDDGEKLVEAGGGAEVTLGPDANECIAEQQFAGGTAGVEGV